MRIFKGRFVIILLLKRLNQGKKWENELNKVRDSAEGQVSASENLCNQTIVGTSIGDDGIHFTKLRGTKCCSPSRSLFTSHNDPRPGRNLLHLLDNSERPGGIISWQGNSHWIRAQGSNPIDKMVVSFIYWDDCVDPQDMEAMWNIAEVRSEWLNAGETRGQKVHLSRDPDGQPYLTQTEIKAVVDIIIYRHFGPQIDPSMICAISELESDRQPLATRYDKKAKDTTRGIMQLLPKTVDWLYRELHYQSYDVEGNPDLLFRPFVNIYFGAAYLKWLSNFDQKERSEEFVVRAYKGGTKKATHKSTLPFWQRYLSAKESFLPRKMFEDGLSLNDASSSSAPVSPSVPSPQNTSVGYTCWDSRASAEDMEEMWNHPEVLKEWSKSGERKGKVRFSHDEKKQPYLSRVEVKAVAEIILSKHFSTKELNPTVLCALAEVVSMRFVNGVGPRVGIMGMDYTTAFWLYMELGFRAYKVDSVDDLIKPFVSMYFGAAYFMWLSEYEGRERTPQFIIQAYMVGPKNVNFQDAGPIWLKFEDALGYYQDIKKDQGSCSIM